MTTLVTGGTGFVGGAIVRELLRQGEHVRVLARRPSAATGLAESGVEVVQGDIMDQASVESALNGCDTLYHAAAVFDFWIPDKRVMAATTDGARNVLEAAIRAGTPRIIYTGAASTIGERKGEVGDETTAHRGYSMTTYERAEVAAERLVRGYVDQGLPVISVLPASVYGPGNFKPVGRGIINLINGRVPAKFNGVVSYVYLDDVGRGHVLAGQRGKIGERYILSGSNVTMAEWFEAICRLTGIRVPPTIPIMAARAYAECGELVARVTKRPPTLPRDLLTICAHGFQVDGSKAEREIGMTYTPLEEGLRATIQWYWEHGHLKRRPACVA
ncbi:MAG TPA: NAD-dependent epimerase/dehydratase family protein [Thermomicrobiales bacterium]|nr:NAD-dependent epimerase/dehydratase family protein [Thermomicrobiales bacterium]